MKHASQWALLSAAVLVGIAYSCATPEEVTGCPPGATSSDCDVTLVPASDFDGPDASVIAQGGSAGAGVNPSGGGAGSGSNNPPTAGAAGTGSPSTAGSAGSGAAGTGQTAGAGGAAGSGAAGTAGTAGCASGGAGGTAGSGAAGSGAAGSGAAGAGGTTAQSIFDPASCDFDDLTGCGAPLGCTCAQEQCGARCTNIVECLKTNVTCITEADPLCAVRTNGVGKACTSVVDTGGGVDTTNANQPAAIVRAFVNCVCSNPRP
jgi:hypothetical protein